MGTVQNRNIQMPWKASKKFYDKLPASNIWLGIPFFSFLHLEVSSHMNMDSWMMYHLYFKGKRVKSLVH